MKELFVAYLEEPTLENFLALRSAVMADEKYNPYSSELDGIDELFEREDYQGVLERIHEALFPNHILSPDAHFTLSFAHHQLGDENAADAEGMLAVVLLKGLELTGDGSREKPILVARVSDEYDYLRANKLTLAQQSLMGIGDREYDVINTEERGEVWFDITEMKGILSRQMGSR